MLPDQPCLRSICGAFGHHALGSASCGFCEDMSGRLQVERHHVLAALCNVSLPLSVSHRGHVLFVIHGLVAGCLGTGVTHDEDDEK